MTRIGAVETPFGRIDDVAIESEIIETTTMGDAFRTYARGALVTMTFTSQDRSVFDHLHSKFTESAEVVFDGDLDFGEPDRRLRIGGAFFVASVSIDAFTQSLLAHRYELRSTCKIDVQIVDALRARIEQVRRGEGLPTR